MIGIYLEIKSINAIYVIKNAVKTGQTNCKM